MDRLMYSVHGLRLESALPMPQLVPIDDSGPADVTITIGTVDRPEAPTDSDGFVVRDSRIVLDVPGTATFEARDGREIVVAPAPQADVETVRLFLLGSLMGAILHQRGLLPVHASAIRLGDSAVAFCADSGGGKSTLGALLQRRGYAMVCDDVGALELCAEGVFLHPGVPRVRLSTEALTALGEVAAALDGPSRSAAKHEVPLEHLGGAAAAGARLQRLYVLSYDEGTAVRIEPLDKWSAFLELRGSIYRPALIRSLSLESEFLHKAETIVSEVDVFRLGRPRDLARLKDVLAPLEAHLADLSAGATLQCPQ